MKKRKKVRQKPARSTTPVEPEVAKPEESEPHQPNKPLRWPLWTALALALTGSGLALYASYHSMRVRWHGLENPSGCSVTAWVNCDAVQASSYAFLYGLPIAWWGLLYYACIGLLVLWVLVRKPKDQLAATVAFLISLGGLGFSLYKAATLIFILKTLCLVCGAMYVVNFGLVFAFWQVFRTPLRDLPGRIRIVVSRAPRVAVRLALYGLFIGSVLVGGSVLADYLERNYLKLTEIDVDHEVAKHFEKSRENRSIHPEAPVWGNPEAMVTLVEYSDFECRFCRRAAFHLRGLLWEFRDQVRLVFMNYPLDHKVNRNIRGRIHDNAGIAALAAICAQKRGKFWEFHDDLFRSTKALRREVVLDLADEHGWDREGFAASLDSPETLERLHQEINYAGRIPSTPWLLANGRRVEHWGHPEIVQRIIREEIRRQNEK